MKTIGPQKEWLGTYRFNPRCNKKFHGLVSNAFVKSLAIDIQDLSSCCVHAHGYMLTHFMREFVKEHPVSLHEIH